MSPTKEGYFTVSDLGAATYMYSVSATGYAQHSAWDAGRRVDLSKGGDQNLGDIPLLQAGGLTGVVVDAKDSKPIAGAHVELEQPGSFGRLAQHSANTDEQGRFEIKDVPAGQYTLRASAGGFAPATVEKVAVEPGKTADAGTIKLGRGFALEGKVVDGAGAGVAGATVKVSEAQGNTGIFWGGGQDRVLSSAVSAEKGDFRIEGMAEGSASATVEAAGFARLKTVVDLKPGMGPLTLRLGKGAKVTGRVLSTDGKPAAGASVGLLDHNNQLYAAYKIAPAQFADPNMLGVSDLHSGAADDGRFAIENVPEGVYLLLAAPKQGRGVAKDDVKVVDGRDLDVGDLQLQGPGTAVVRVTEDGQPVSGLGVELREGFGGVGGPGGEQAPRAKTDGQGVAEFKEVQAGDYVVFTERDKDAWDTEIFQKRRITVRGGQTTEFKLELKPADAAVVRGRMTMDGKPQFTELMLVGTGQNKSFFKQGKTDESGFYKFEGVPLGTFVLNARIGDKIIASIVPLTLDKPGEVEVTRDFSSRTVWGTVNTPANSAAERASVRVTLQRLNDPNPEETSQWLRGESRCDAEGRFKFEFVTAGSYRITASLENVGSVGKDINVGGSDVTGADLSIANNSGSLRVTIKKLHGTPLSAQSFGMVQVKDASGHVLDFEGEGTGFFVPANNVQVELPTVPAGTYTIIVSAMACISVEKAGVEITVGKRTEVEVEIKAAAELHMTVTNTEITQAMLDAAKVTYFDGQGTEVAKATSMFDSMLGGAAPEKPTLRARGIGPTVTQVKIKMQGYAEVVVPVEFEAGRKIEKQESLVAG